MMPKNMKTCLLFLVIALLAHTSAHRLSNLFYLRYLPPSPQNVDRSADTTTDTQDRELGTSPDTLVVDNLLNNIGTNHPIYKPSPVDKSGTGVNGADRSRMFNGDGTPNGNRAGMLPFRPQAVVPVNTDRAGGNTVDDMLSNLMSSRPTYIVDRDRDIGGPDPTDPQLPSGQPSNPAPSPSLPLPMPVAPVYPGRSKNSNGAVIITDNGAVFLRNSKTDPKAVTENVATPDDRDGNNNSTFVEPIVNDKPFEAANLDKWLNPDKETGKTSHSNEEDTTKDSDNSSNSSDDSDDDNSSNSKDDSEERGESGRSLNFPLNREFTVPPFSPYSGFDKDDNNNEQDENKKEILSVNGRSCASPKLFSPCEYYDKCFASVHNRCKNNSDFMGDEATQLCHVAQTVGRASTSNLLKDYLKSVQQCVALALKDVVTSPACEEVSHVVRASLLPTYEEKGCMLQEQKLCRVMEDPVASTGLANIFQEKSQNNGFEMTLLINFGDIAFNHCDRVKSASFIETLTSRILGKDGTFRGQKPPTTTGN